ncbi:2-hydroxychromene-2-carboxylate isomerase [Cupriavidus lacunae]|uniref:2-hydroxychromene-2-carboxylate isomerase n=1 Tax=Cupriavidus lacunae TaxID=2666307 RepID=A0A370P0V3_9BURK|nr:2-hydroxychromene-2-carboxylate isomerase [Cupriavidus lacunae]RDK11447.1 2-hydroxychromene-2-carboxylate isomerase [Cupriavidus lacunae]
MGKIVEFFFDVGSPAAYLAWTQLPKICDEGGGTLVFRPMLLGGVFRATGNASPVSVPAKGRYVELEYGRYARRYGVPFKTNSHFPIITLHLMRVVTGMQIRHPERFHALLAVLFKAMWVDDLDLNDPVLASRTLSEAGLSPEQVDGLVNDPQIKEALKAATEEAVTRGVFGAPTTFVNGEMFFGQDKLDFVKEALMV